jgi:hypothetical protein
MNHQIAFIPNCKSSVDWCDIFNSQEFYKLHQIENSFYLACLNQESNKVIGVCHFSEFEKGKYISPYRGTYGGFDMFGFNLDELNYFVSQSERFLTEKGAKQITIVSPPFEHDPAKGTFLFNFFMNNGYSISNHEINHTILVNETSLVDKMNRNNKKRLKKCEREGFEFKQVTGKEESEEVYQIIVKNRLAKGKPITMTFDQIMDMNKAFPESLFFFKVTNRLHEAIASSICIRLNKKILYVFYWGDLTGYEQHSPIALIADGIYKFAQHNQYLIMDLGISTYKGELNSGLIKFKENLGFEPSLKLTYSKNLSE